VKRSDAVERLFLLLVFTYLVWDRGWLVV